MYFEEFCRLNDIHISYTQLPTKTRGFCYYDDGYYIVINSCLDIESNESTLVHELIHILENHFNYTVQQAQHCESEVQYYTKQIITIFRAHIEQ